MGLSEAALSLPALEPSVGLCIAIAWKVVPYIRAVLRQGLVYLDLLDDQLYHNRGVVSDALTAAAAAAADARGGNGDDGDGDEVPALVWRPRLAPAGTGAPVGPSLRLAGGDATSALPKRHTSCPLFTPSLHGGVLALVEGCGGVLSGDDLAVLEALFEDACGVGAVMHARFLASVLPDTDGHMRRIPL